MSPQSHLAVSSLPHACRFGSLSLMCLHPVQLLLPRPSSDVSLFCTLPCATAGTRPFFWQNGPPLLVLCSPALLSGNASWLPVGALSSSFNDGGKLPLPHSIVTLRTRVLYYTCGEQNKDDVLQHGERLCLHSSLVRELPKRVYQLFIEDVMRPSQRPLFLLYHEPCSSRSSRSE